jgi:hypothetical protein
MTPLGRTGQRARRAVGAARRVRIRRRDGKDRVGASRVVIGGGVV